MAGATRRADSPETTRARLLQTAETHFAAHGYDGTSLRAVTSDAGVNLAAVNYHFGSKAGLLAAVLERRLGGMNQARLARLTELQAAGEPALRDLIEAFIGVPVRWMLSQGEEAQVTMQLVGRSHTSPNEVVRQVLDEQFGEVARRFHAAFTRALPDVTAEDVTFRMMGTIGVMKFFLSAGGRPASHLPHHSGDPEELVERVVGFVMPGFSAPSS
jgi:AcrR family transcriptional regulator